MAALTAAVTKLAALIVMITMKRIKKFWKSVKPKRSSDMKFTKRKCIFTQRGGSNGKRKT